MRGRGSDPHQWRQPQPLADESTSNDSIIDLSNQESDGQRQTDRSRRAPPIVPTAAGSSNGFVRYAQGSPWTANSPHTPDQNDDSESSTGPLRHPVPAVERVLRLPDFSRFAGREMIGSDVMTPPARTGTDAGQDGWLMGRRMASPPAGRTWGAAGTATDARYQQTPSDTTFEMQTGFRPFPLPPPTRNDLYGRPLGVEDRGRQRDAAGPSTSVDQSGMDFTMASYTSPTQREGRAMGFREGLGGQTRAAPPTIESIEREIAYWRRNPSTLSGHQAVTSPLETPHPGLDASSDFPVRTRLPVARSSTLRDDTQMSQSLPRNISAETRRADATASGGSNGDSNQNGEASPIGRPGDLSLRDRYREGSHGDSMDVSDDSSRDIRSAPVSASAAVHRSRMAPQEHLAVPREPRRDISASDSDISVGTRHQLQNISDSLISSDVTMDRGIELAVDDERDEHPRIDEEPELELENSRDQDDRGEGDDQAEDEDDEGEDDEDDDDDDSHASSTRHLKDDELEMLILQNNFGFRGTFAPGSRIGTFDLMESDVELGSASGRESDMGSEGSCDELGIRPATKASRAGATSTGHRKKKRTGRPKKRPVFDIEKRREQWLSEMEDRALRRGPVMGITQEDFKNGRLTYACGGVCGLTGVGTADMLEPKEWKQLIDYELSESAWKYIPVIGPGFVPYADLAQVAHPGPAARTMQKTTLAPGPPHSHMQRSRHITMAETATAYEAIAYGQAGEEYGIRVLPLGLQDPQHDSGEAEDRGEHVEHTVSDSDTEVATLGLERNEVQRGGRQHRHGYLEGSFGRLNVEDSHRLRNVYPS